MTTVSITNPTPADTTRTAAPLRVSNVTKTYLKGTFKTLDNVSFNLRANEITAFVGPSGCGKTTMLRIIAGLEFPSNGRVEAFGKPVLGPGPDRGMIFQAYTSFPWLTAFKNVEYGMRVMGVPKAERQERAHQFLKLVHLERFADAYPKSLSGGMKQRVALARTLAQNPSILLMDEPFGALDPITREALGRATRDLHDKLSLTTMMVTHDVQEALLLADRILVMAGGKLLADATPRELLRGHPDPAVAALIDTPARQARALSALMEAGA